MNNSDPTFFVKYDETASEKYTDTINLRKFHINSLLVPEFISKETADLILQVGKINLLLNIENSSPDKYDFDLSNIFSICKKIHRDASYKLNAVLIESRKTYFEFSDMFYYLLFMKNDFCQAFLELSE